MSPQYRVPTGRNKKLSFLVSPLLAYITPRFKRCFNAIVLFQLMKQEWKRQALNRSLINTAQKLVSQKLGFSIKWLLKYLSNWTKWVTHKRKSWLNNFKELYEHDMIPLHWKLQNIEIFLIMYSTKKHTKAIESKGRGRYDRIWNGYTSSSSFFP